jgi:ribonuclease Y
VDPVTIIAAVVALAVGAVAGRMLWGRTETQQPTIDFEAERAKLEQQKAEAARQAEVLLKAAQANADKAALEREKKVERDLQKRRAEIDRTEARLRKREEQLEKTEEKVNRKAQEAMERADELGRKVASVEQERAELEKARLNLIQKAEQVAQMSVEEARRLLLENLERDLRADAAALVRRAEEEARQIADRKARQIVTLAVQRVASETVAETTVTVVQLPNDEMKGRIIGREGRNIRTLEQLTGVNFIIDDTPEAVVLSCFDPMRREVARLVLEQLVADGRIHPARIEELVEKTERRVLDIAREAAEKACIDLGIHDLHPELVKAMGRLHFRTSYGQNVLRHSVEVARLGEMLASELGVEARLAKRASFLHDIGKSATQDQEGTHAAIGAELARRFHERQEVVHAIAAHHFEVEPKTLTAMLVIAADSISAARPGARRESLENYIKRLQALEAIANGFDGVEKSYAIQAGREVRIIVEPEKVSDDMCALLARDITKKIEAELQYPGQIKVTVVREIRKTEYAR